MALSAVHRGVAFEQRSLEVLQRHLSMSLRKVGGKSDGGVDLQGWWWVPTPPPQLRSGTSPPSPPSPPLPALPTTGPDGEPRQPLRVLGQCKAEAKKVGPNYVREMEGVLHRYHHHRHYDAPGGAPPPPVVALLVSQSPFTRTTVLRAFSSPIPFFLLHLPPAPAPPPPLSKDNAPPPPREDGQPPPAEDDGLGAAIWNPALAGEAGLLRGEMEVRWERSPTYGGGGRPGLWWKGHRLKGWTPGSEVVMDDDVW